MNSDEKQYNAGGSFKTTIGKTNYEVILKFKEEGMSLQEKTLRAIKNRKNEDEKPS